MRPLLLSVLIVATSVRADPKPKAAPAPPPLPCQTHEYRQLDFWVGQWDLDYDLPDGKTGHATNRITRDELGSCVIHEHFEQAANGYRGESVATYDAPTRLWRQTWVDTGGAFIELEGGEVSGKPYRFELHTVRAVSPKKLLYRMIWEDVTPESLVWRWQSRDASGKWKDAWVLRYKRRVS
jgi:hypothetical protein